MRYQLKAIGPDGRIESVHFQAPDKSSAVRQLEGQGYTVLSVKANAELLGLWRSVRTRFPVALFSQQLLVLLNAGLPLVESIETLAAREKREDMKTVFEQIAGILRQGRPLSAALEQFPQAFTPLYVATVRAAERTSDLAPALGRYVAYEQQVEALRKHITNASIYPLLLIGVGGLVTLFLLFYVVPRFAHVYEERATDAPLFSKLLLAWGQSVEGHGMLAIALMVGFVMAVIYAVRMPRIRLAAGDLLWAIPAFGERLKVYQLARFYRTTGMLLRGGIPLVSALQMGAELLHPLLRDKLASATRAISEGHAVSRSMDENGLTTPVALRMLSVGEQSGNMGEMMDRIATFHDEEISRWVEWFTRLFEPLLMAAIGLVIGAIVILMYMPIFELAGSLQ